MRAVVRYEYGGPDVLKIEEIDKPELVDAGVLVRVRAAALNPTDYIVMRGFLRLQTGWRRPRQRVVGIDVAGIVEAVGADVADLAVGDAVFGVCRGALAEYAVGVPRNLVQKPERLSFEQAAGMGVAGTMAMQALRDSADDPRPDPRDTIVLTVPSHSLARWTRDECPCWSAPTPMRICTDAAYPNRSMSPDTMSHNDQAM
jgi:NADPH:quinone reductase-like Zn-dependent oxidoreductase